MRKLLIVLVLSAISAALAQNNAGWQHTVGPVCGEPFTDVLLPWPAEAVQLAEIKDCCRDTEPPFLGSEWRFWCYTRPSSDSSTPLVGFDAAYKDAGYCGVLVGELMPQENGSIGFGSYDAPADGAPRQVYVFERDGTLLIGFAAR